MLILLNRLWITYPNVFVPKAANDTRALFYTIKNGSHISMQAVILFGRGGKTRTRNHRFWSES
jgi:hypothetical protein